MENIKQINNNTPQKLVYGGYGHSPSGKQYVYKGGNNLRVGQSVVAPVTNAFTGKTYNTMFTIQRTSNIDSEMSKNEQDRLQQAGIQLKTIQGGLSVLSLPTGTIYDIERKSKQGLEKSPQRAIAKWKKDSEIRRANERGERLQTKPKVFLEEKTHLQELKEHKYYKNALEPTGDKELKQLAKKRLEKVFLGRYLEDLEPINEKTTKKKPIDKKTTKRKKKNQQVASVRISKIKTKKTHITKFMLEWEKRMPEIYKRLEQATRIEKRSKWTEQAKQNKAKGAR